MELTLQAAFSAQGLIGHLSYILLVVSMLSYGMIWLRIGVIGSAIAGIIYAAMVIHDPVALFWESLLLAVNIIQLARVAMKERLVTFNDDELSLRKSYLSELSNSNARDVLDQGYWISARTGEELTREESAVDHLFFLAEGEASVFHGDRQVGVCKAGDLIGESTVLQEKRASGTVVLVQNSRLWCAPAASFRQFLAKKPDIRNLIERQIGNSLMDKLHDANRLTAAD